MSENHSELVTKAIRLRKEVIKRGEFIFDKSLGDDIEYYAPLRMDTLLMYLIRTSDNLRVFMKIPLGETAEREIRNTYEAHRRIGDTRNLEPLLEHAPREYRSSEDTTHKAILSGRADYTLDDYLKVLTDRQKSGSLQQKDKENELLNIISQTCSGLIKGHNNNIVHKDIKESNMILYQGDWCLNDWGFCSIITDYMSRDATTRTIRQGDSYLEYELLKNLNNPTKRRFNFSTDIFSMGVVLYKGTDSEGLSPLDRHKKLGIKKLYSPEWVLSDIEKSDRTKDVKYFLKRMLGEGIPPKLAEDPSNPLIKNYRYTTLNQFFADVNRESSKNDGLYIDPNYLAFKRENASFNKLITQTNQNRDSNGFISHKAIDKIVTTYEQLSSQKNWPGINNIPEAQDLFLKTTEIYDAVKFDEYLRLKSLNEKIKKRNSSDTGKQDMLETSDMLELFKDKLSLWGPLISMEITSKPQEDPRYTYEQIMRKDTDYHKKIDKLRLEIKSLKT